MVLEHNVTLSNDTIVLYVQINSLCMAYLLIMTSVWISSANAAAVAAKNFRLVHGPSDYFYLVGVVLSG